MTQSYNLSQLANNLTSAGLLDAADGLVNAVPIANGGTGASSASAARTNLVVPSTTGTGASGTWGISITGSAADLSATLAVTKGGTGLATLTANNLLVGAGTSSPTFIAPSTAGNVLVSNGTVFASVADTSIGYGQTWQVVSRTSGTNYTNNTGKPISLAVSVYASGSGSHVTITISGVLVIQQFSSSINVGSNVTAIIPNGAVYSYAYSGTTVTTVELR